MSVQEQRLTLQQNKYCVSYDAECGEENQNREDVGTDGVCQLKLRLWSQGVTSDQLKSCSAILVVHLKSKVEFKTRSQQLHRNT